MLLWKCSPFPVQKLLNLRKGGAPDFEKRTIFSGMQPFALESNSLQSLTHDSQQQAIVASSPQSVLPQAIVCVLVLSGKPD